MRTVVRRAALTIAATLVAATATAADFRLLELGGFHVKWGEPRLGSRAEISYGFADGRRSFPDAINCRELEAAERLPVAQGELAKVAAEAFRLWSAAAAVSFREARPGERPDILIGAQGRPEGIAFANVWPDRGRAHDGVAPLAEATICLNPTLAWVPDAAGRGQADLGTVLAHEIGHALGLDHPGPTGALMGYRDQGDIDVLMAGDVGGAVALYGPPKR